MKMSLSCAALPIYTKLKVFSPRSLIYQQAANRTYVQQALMLHLLGIPVD